MGKIFVILLILIGCAVLWCLPLYLIANFVSLVFHLSFHLTLLQSFALCLLISMIHNMLSKKEDK